MPKVPSDVNLLAVRPKWALPVVMDANALLQDIRWMAQAGISRSGKRRAAPARLKDVG